MNHPDDLTQNVGIDRRHHAVAQVEHVAGMATVASEHVAGALDGRSDPGQHHCRIEVALERDVVPEASAGPVEGNPPVDADHVGARVADQLQQFAGGHPEVDAGHTRVGHRGQHPGGVGEHVAFVLRR